MPSLRTSIHALTSDHLTTTPLGTATAKPLMVQLEQAIKPDKGGGQANGNGKGDLINLTAMALWEEIASDIAIHTIEAGLTPKPDRIESLRQWATMEDDMEWGDFLARVALDWCDRIAAMLSPIKPFHPAQPCPACGQMFAGDDRAPSLSVHHLGPDGKQLHPEAWVMDCLACDSSWSGDTLGAMAWAMSAQVATM